MMTVIYTLLLILAGMCKDYYVHPSGSGSCLKKGSECTVEYALSEIQKNCDTAIMHFTSGDYQVKGNSYSLSCSQFSMIGISTTTLSLESQYFPLLTFEKDVSVSMSQISFKNVERTIMSAFNSQLDLSLTSVNFSAGIRPLVNDTYKLRSLSMKSVFVSDWSNGFILIRDNGIGCTINIENVKFVNLQNTCPIAVELDIHNPDGAVTATLTDFWVENSQNIFHPSSAIGILANTMSVTCTRCTMKNGFFGAVFLKSLYDLDFKLLDGSSISGTQGLAKGGAIYVTSEWGKVTVNIEDSFFEQNEAQASGGAMVIESNDTVTFTSTNTKYRKNTCHSGSQQQGGGAIRILQTDQRRAESKASTIQITGDTYEYQHTGKSFGGVYWISLRTYEMTIVDSRFYNNQAGFAMLGQGQNKGGVMYLGSWDSVTLTIRNSEFVNNTGSNGGVLYMTNWNTTNDVTIENSNFTNNRAFDEDCEYICQTGKGGVFYMYMMQTEAIEHPSVEFKLRNNHFEQNSAVWDGGVIYMFEDDTASRYNVEMTGNVFKENSAWGSGTGFMWESNGVLNSNRFEGNKVGTEGRYQARGGGLCWNGGKTVLIDKDNVFFGNSANQYGGGIAIIGVESFIINEANTIENNHAVGGGGIYLKDVPHTELHSPIKTNQATYGGGLVLDLSDTDHISLTNQVTKNTAPYGAGVYVISGNVKNMPNFEKYVSGNNGVNLMSNPVSIRKKSGSTSENKCNIGGKNNEWWNCRVYDLEFLDIFGDVMKENTLTSFSVKLIFPGHDFLVVTTEETDELVFSFLPQYNVYTHTVPLSVSSLSGYYDAVVSFVGLEVLNIKIFFDDGKKKETKSYMWVLYMCLILLLCCLYICCLFCLTGFVFLKLLYKMFKNYDKYEYKKIINQDVGDVVGSEYDGNEEEKVGMLTRDEYPTPIGETDIEVEGSNRIQLLVSDDEQGDSPDGYGSL